MVHDGTTQLLDLRITTFRSYVFYLIKVLQKLFKYSLKIFQKQIQDSKISGKIFVKSFYKEYKVIPSDHGKSQGDGTGGTRKVQL